LTTASGKFLLDTNIVIAFLEGESQVLSHLGLAAEVFIPAVAFGELFFGAANSGRPLENRRKLEQFAAASAIAVCDLAVAREYGFLKQQLKDKGRPIPDNDIWIAATAKRHGMILVTRDRHFKAVEDLETVDWATAKG